MNREEKNQIANEGINLIDYIRIILKKKWLILGFLLVGLIIAGVFSLSFPKSGRVETVIEIGVAGKDLLENPSQVVEKIKSGVYGDYPGIKVENPNNTNLVKIEAISEDRAQTIKALEGINNTIVRDHEEKKAAKETVVKKEIEKIQTQINFLEEEKKTLEAKIDTLEKIPPAQQTFSIQFALLDTKGKLSNMEKEIWDLSLLINTHQKSLEDILSTKIIKEPTAFEESLQTRILFNTILAGILGLFLGIFLALGKEWWEKNKAKI